MRIKIWGWLLTLCLTATAQTPASGLALQMDNSLTMELAALEKSFSGRFGFMAKNLGTGEVIAWKADEKFPTASVIKLPVMVEFFCQVAQGRLDPMRKVILAGPERRGGSGVLQFFTPEPELRLADAVLLMIVLSDNSATNLVIDALGETHAQKLAAVNGRMASLGLRNTRLLNRLMAWSTKTDSSESIRYGVGVSTPADMVLLLEQIWRRQLADSLGCARMIDILGEQLYDSSIPRFLPAATENNLRIAHKTGSVTGVAVDVGLVLSPRADFAIAAFTEQAPDRRGSILNQADLAIARAARLAWNRFTGDSGSEPPMVTSIDWNSFPGGEWTRVLLKNSPFPHPSRQAGHDYQGRHYPADPHYSDSSAVIIIPEGYQPANGKVDLIVHFHGWKNDNLTAMERFRLPQQLAASRRNAILVLPQGPWHAEDSSGGRMEEEGGFGRMIAEIIGVLQSEGRIGKAAQLGQVAVSAHSGGYRPAIRAISRGGLGAQISTLFLFDALYGLSEELIPWLKADKRHRLFSTYTEHLRPEHEDFEKVLRQNRLRFAVRPPLSRQRLGAADCVLIEPAAECHDCVMTGRLQRWLEQSSLEPIK